MLKLKKLSADELSGYCDAYTRRSGVLLSPPDVAGSRVYGMFKQSVLVGGFVVKTEGPFRAVQAIRDPQAREEISLLAHGAVEVTGLWLDVSVRNAFYRFALIAAMLVSGQIHGDGRVIGITTKLALWEKAYRPMGAELLFRGATEITKGLPRDGFVFQFAVSRVWHRIPRYLFRKSRKFVLFLRIHQEKT